MADEIGGFLDMWFSFSGWFWSESFWLPPNVTWKDLERNASASSEAFYASANDLWIVFPLSIAISTIRLLWESTIALRLGRWFGISELKRKMVAANPLLEAHFMKYKKRRLRERDVMPTATSPIRKVIKFFYTNQLSFNYFNIFTSNGAIYNPALICWLLTRKDPLITLFAKQLDWPMRKVERWWRVRKVQDKPSDMKRFQETCWRFVYYVGIFVYGICILCDKPFFWDLEKCYYGFPWLHISADIYWYYMIEGAFYVSLVMSLFTDIKRKDFLQMIVHHIATLVLMFVSWSINQAYFGSMVLVLHDVVDGWMEAGKLAKYCGYHKLCDFLFVCFTVLWFITRLVIFPFWILHSAYFDCQRIIGPTPAVWIPIVLLSVLQVLHIMWFCMIARMLITYIRKGQVEKDDRSDTEPEMSSEDEITNESSSLSSTKPTKMNGNADRADEDHSSGDYNSITGGIASNGIHKRGN